MKTSELEQIKEVMRAVLREERGKAAIAEAPVEMPGNPVVLQCGCGQEKCKASFRVLPIKVGGEKRIHLVPGTSHGLVLSKTDRIRLFRILADLDWFGEQTNADGR